VSTAAPHELPPDIGLFVGRTAETAQLRAALAGDKRDAVRPRVLVLYGQGGVGKSTLAVHFGQAVREGFPDGQLYLDLHGSTPGLRQLSPSDALGRLLRSLGVPRKEVPADEAEAAAHFRTLTADSRLFVLLDNASDATQVLPLLPGGAGCAVVITSRTPLAAIDADCRVRLDVLSPHEGATLLQRVAGHAPADAPAITRIVDFCECLPLAIRIAAGRLSSRPDLTVHELADRLADDRRRLDELELEGLALRSCIRVGYDALAASHTHVDQLAACAFRCLGLLDVPSVQIDVIGAMLDTPDLHLVRLAVDRLVTAQLVEATAGGRYRLHDLVRLVAAEVAVEQDSPETRNEVLERAFCYYLQNLTAAEDAIRPERVAHAVKEFPKMRADGVIFSAPKHAAAWLDTEIANLVAAAEQAGRPPGIHRRFALWITYWAWPSLHTRCEFQTAGRLAMLVMESAYCHDDRAMIGWAHFLRGRYDADSGNYDAALDNLRRALSIIGASNPYGTATVLIGLGIASSQRGRPEEAAKYFADCIDHASRYKLVGVGATATHNLGNACMILGRWDEARAHVVKALAIREAIDHREGIGSSLDTLAAIHCHNGAFAEAVRCAERAAAFHQEDGDQLQECNALLIRAEVRLRQGLYRATLDEAEDLLALSRRRGYPYGEAAALQLSAKAANLLGDQSGAEQRSALAAELFARPSVHEPVISVLLHETDSLLPGDRNPHPVEQADADQES
jgi:tetratricopeptide (TPR) repeat protein